MTQLFVVLTSISFAITIMVAFFFKEQRQGGSGKENYSDEEDGEEHIELVQ